MKVSVDIFKREILEITSEKFENSKIASIFNEILYGALKNGGSDIHLEPFLNCFRIRYRVDGKLEERAKIDKVDGVALVSKLKLLSELDIGEKRFPQDGKFRGRYENRNVDFRVSTMPTLNGEKCVVRILKELNEELYLENLGFSEENYNLLIKNIGKKSGMIIVTGPTGSGKTTTLYSILNSLNSEEVNILTIEDPIEYEIDGINQVQCKMEIGLSFSKILRGFLRQDPDIIFIGEIRDKETAEIAIRASLTGHLVLTSLHTKDSISAVGRLKDLGVEPYMIAQGVTFIQSQRLVRKMENGKYRGRVVIEEVLEIDDKVQEYILNNFSEKEIKDRLKQKGMVFLYERGMKKVEEGITTEEEILKECSL